MRNLSATLGADDEKVRCVVTTLRLIAEVAPEQLTVGAIEDLAEITRMRLSARLARPARDPTTGRSPRLTPVSANCAASSARFWSIPDVSIWIGPWQNKVGAMYTIGSLAMNCRSGMRREGLGRPYTLVLTKTSALFERERRARDVDLVDLRWLETIPLPRPKRDDDQGPCSTA